MYLYKKTYKVDENLKQKGVSHPISSIEKEANQIHNWFVHNVQKGVDDDGTYFVSEEQLEELLELCKKVLHNNELADELLPSIRGDYDEFYFSKLTRTVEIIESLRNEDGHLDPISYILTEVGYWRRTYQIHSWFIHKFQNYYKDCGSYFVSKEQLEELLELCKKVLHNNELADELLPCSSEDYDEFYFSELTSTVEIIESLRNEDGHLDGDFYYSASI